MIDTEVTQFKENDIIKFALVQSYSVTHTIVPFNPCS